MKIFFLYLVSCAFLLVSCTTTEAIFTSLNNDGYQINFLRPFDINIDNKNIKNFSMDITVASRLGEIVSNPTLNYTFRKLLDNNEDIENITVGLICGDNEIIPLSKKLLYKSIGHKKYLEVRFTSELDKDVFQDMVNSNKSWNLLIIYPNLEKTISFSDTLNKKIQQLKIIK